MPLYLNGKQKNPRTKVELVSWTTEFGDMIEAASPAFCDANWKKVTIPHNWEDYHGYHAVSHGNLHGTAWYRTNFHWQGTDSGDRLYVFFEGVGSYATVYCNGILIGEHAGGRTTFTLDLTPGLVAGENLLAVRAHHPEKIDDLPFVCGGCWGAPNTEGSQPLGIFRPVWLEQMGPVRVEPFGLHVFTPYLERNLAQMEARIEIRNAGDSPHEVEILTRILDSDGCLIFSDKAEEKFAPDECRLVSRLFPDLDFPRLWSPNEPHLYTAEVEIRIEGEVSHFTATHFGLRWLDWPTILNIAPAPDLRSEHQAATQMLLHSPEAPQSLRLLDPQITIGDGLPAQANLVIDLGFEVETPVQCRLLCEIQDQNGTVFFHHHRATLELGPASSHCWEVPAIHQPSVWTHANPCYHKLIVELSDSEGKIWARQQTFFGIRQIAGNLSCSPSLKSTDLLKSENEEQSSERRLLVNGEPFFINGTCEYETLLGADHSFTPEQIDANVAMMKSAGFNSFRDAHHPHNLRYYRHWDEAGMLCWTQMGSHVWFDNDRFRSNFRQLVVEWVRERRNHPCVVMWGLQNESVLPEDFAREICQLVKELDPSTGTSRITTTCNGGAGTDWNVPQEWSGTYGGNFNQYNLAPLQLVGEYGAWRDFGVHTEIEYLGDENDRSESWACQAMETKIRLGEQSRDLAIGHFHWIFNSFPNPGRSPDNYEGPDNAQVGSINNKGLLTVWNQPSDLYHLFRANYAAPERSPMVYLVSHTWPHRWVVPGPKTIRVYSNCDFVELFNGEEENSLGIRQNPGRGKHFVWNHVELKSNVLCAVAWFGGKRVARDILLFDHLPDEGLLGRWAANHINETKPDCLHRISCGDPHGFVDRFGNQWIGDLSNRKNPDWFNESWANDYPEVASDLASSGYTMSPVSDTCIPELYRTYRFGRTKLKYHFALPSGSYEARLHFLEPWYGVGGGLNCTGWRVFDVAVGGKTVIHDLDIWKEAGGDHRALVHSFHVTHKGGMLSIEFPEVRVNQAIIAGIEIFMA